VQNPAKQVVTGYLSPIPPQLPTHGLIMTSWPCHWSSFFA